MDSKIGLLIQLAGVCLISLLTIFMRRSLRVAALRYWTNAWLCLTVALLSLRMAAEADTWAKPLYSFFFFGEYVFGFLLVTGCRSLSGKYRPQLRDELVILPFAAAAVVLTLLEGDVALVFSVHACLLASFFVFAFRALRDVPMRTFGWYVMRVALALLVVDLVQYFIVSTARQIRHFEAAYLAYNPIIDLVLQILLGFGMVIVLLEQVLEDSRRANDKLSRAHRRLEMLAHVDPLTAAFNRHAFYGYLRKRGEDGAYVSGCVGFFDVDELKKINDRYGHLAGDRVIRAVAAALRKVMRAEDLIYRWGGDEFFVIMVSMSAEAATHRMQKLDEMLTGVSVHGVGHPVDISVSYGFTDFEDLSDLEAAIRLADAAMYERKQQRKLRSAAAPAYDAADESDLEPVTAADRV
ncbi:MAG: GGDEF domain-containing protein [Pyrinomonadaceae bacterium]